MHDYECVEERGGVWHLAGSGDSWFRRIGCSTEDGVTLPGPTCMRRPTCPDCLELLQDA